MQSSEQTLQETIPDFEVREREKGRERKGCHIVHVRYNTFILELSLTIA